ncbi:MAG: hypothetical protein GY719_16025 [bacterium]|nr:hypothetical protein [bacterium]
MKISVYVPKELEGRLREKAEERSMTPSRFVQSLVRERFEQEPRRFTSAFAGLAGSWEDERSAEEICRELEQSRRDASRSVLR